MKPILEVRNLWKQYKIGGQKASYLSLRERILQPFSRQQQDTFWALQDINFDVFEGDCLGIVGRNGAGKSTLLKILSQITPPTKGYVKARGRVASLLEVGTGFHPELTGRENIYLNGSILGLKRTDINAKLDEIIDFSGVEKFLETPLKHYSSGMRLRLAFSVAAHLEPEILLIDEVLAVGDAEFQKKCLGKMDEVSKSGRTVLFISHNLGAVQQLCQRGILINQGQIIENNLIDKTLDKYYQTIYKQKTIDFNKSPRAGKGDIRVKKIFFTNSKGEQLENQLTSGSDVIFNIQYQKDKNVTLNTLDFGISIYDKENRFVTVLNNKMSNYHFENIPNQGIIQCELRKLPLTYGHFNTTINLNANGILMDKIENAFSFSVLEGDYYDSGFSNCWGRTGVYIDQKWQINS